MEERLGTLAWSMVSDVHSQLENEVSDTRLLIEATRLSVLNQVLSTRLSEDGLILTCLSFEGENSRTPKQEVHEIVSRTIDAPLVKYNSSLESLSLHDFVNLLGWIHSLGSYRLPSTLNHGTSQRSLGAYYTPHPVAEYIVNLTMKNDFERHIHAISKNGQSELEDFLSLKMLDPACGAGVFLVSTAILLETYTKKAIEAARDYGLSKGNIQQILSTQSPNLYGVDLDAGALEVADISLRLLRAKNNENLSPSMLDKTLKLGNSLISLEGLSGSSDHQTLFSNPSRFHAFEWPKEYPEVFNRQNSGFDYIVMNPPYERLKPNFAEYIRERLASGERKIDEKNYKAHKRRIGELTRYYRESTEFHLATSYSINTYLLFLERALQLTSPSGSIGCVVPSNIMGDISAQRLRKDLIQNNKLNVIDVFPEASRLFPGVTQSVAILQITKGGFTKEIDIGFNRSGLNDAAERKRMKISHNQISQTMGPSMVIPRINSTSLKLLDKLHTYSRLRSIPQLEVRRGELDLTINKTLITPKKTNNPLIRGSHISRFRLIESRHKPEYVKMSKFRDILKTSNRGMHLGKKRIACQQISNMSQRWRLKFAPIPPGTVLANSCNYVALHNDEKYLNFYLGLLNSELINWRFQISNFNNHVSIRELQALPIIQPTFDSTLSKNLQQTVENLDYPRIEANVFALYGFNSREARIILNQRNTPLHERKQILARLEELAY